MYTCMVFTIAELSAALPHAGGFFSFTRNAFGPAGGFICGLTDTIEYLLTPAVIVYFIGGYMKSLVPGVDPWVWWLTFYILFVGINIAGVELTLRVGLLVTLAAIAVLVTFYISVPATGSFSSELLFRDAAGQETGWFPGGAAGVFSTLPFAIWFYLAIEQLPLAAEESHNAAVDMPKALLLGIVTLLVLSLFTLVLNSGVGKGAGALGNSDAPLADGFKAVFGDTLASEALTVIALTGLIASFHTIIYAYGRVLFALSRAGYIPRWISITGSTHTPVAALILGAGVGLVCTLALHIFGEKGNVGAALLNMAVFGAVISYIMVMLAFIKLRLSRPELPRPYRSPLGIPGAVVGTVLSLCALAATLTIPDYRHAVIDTVLAVFADMYGRLVGKRFDAEFYAEQIAQGGTHACDYLLTVDMEMEPVAGYRFSNWESGYGDFHLVPDADTLRIASWLPNTAMVLCDLAGESDHQPVAVAPRSMLRKQIERAAALELGVMAGSELEYYLFNNSYRDAARGEYSKNTMEPAGWYIEDYHALQGTREEPFNAAVRRHLRDSGVPVECTKGEWGKGQHELNVRYADVLRMADNHTVYKQCLKEVADAQDVSVTFMAKYSADGAGSSCHVHVSLWRDGENAFPGDGRFGPIECSDTFRWFLGGWMKRVPELMVFYAPNVNSYKRFQAGSWAPTRIAWSRDNRTAGFRVVGSGNSLRIECRIPGADCNPYLTYAAAIASGLDGIVRQVEPPGVFEGNIYEAEELPHVPRTLRDATDRFAESEFARTAFGEEVVEHYLHFFRTEQAMYDQANMIGAAESQFGRLDILFNNAGIMHGDDGDAVSTSEDVWERTLNINLRGVFLGCKYGVPALRRAGGGSVINTASFVALMGAATPQIAYTASKGGVLAMTRELAVVHARENIRFNALCPGPLQTELLMNFLDTEEKKQRRLVHVPMGRFGQAAEMAKAALFLASDDSSYMTGSEFVVDGGITSAYVTPE
eukprot:g10190.t1